MSFWTSVQEIACGNTWRLVFRCFFTQNKIHAAEEKVWGYLHPTGLVSFESLIRPSKPPKWIQAAWDFHWYLNKFQGGSSKYLALTTIKEIGWQHFPPLTLSARQTQPPRDGLVMGGKRTRCRFGGRWRRLEEPLLRVRVTTGPFYCFGGRKCCNAYGTFGQFSQALQIQMFYWAFERRMLPKGLFA